MLIEIENDLFDIVKRIKEIDNNYFVLRNTKTKKFEIHSHIQRNTYALTLPFEKLDSRAVDYVNKTRIENREKLIQEIDKHNEKLEKEKTEKIQEKISNILLKL